MLALGVWTMAWFGWGLVFAAIEGVGVYLQAKGKAKDATLSSFVRRNTSSKTRRRTRHAVLLGWLILTLHLFFGLW